MEYSLNMVFLTQLGIKSSLSISGVKPGITQAEVDALMDTIIAKDVFKATTGALVSKNSAQLVAKNITKYTLA